MAIVGQHDATVVAQAAAAIVGRLNDRMADLSGSIQEFLITEIAELRGDAQLLQLLRDSIDGNVATVFSAIRHGIPIDKVELPTAAVEHARRMAQRGTTVNALVRAYRLGHKSILDAVLDEIGASDLEPPLSLAVFSQISEVTFGYIDWITQQVVITYQDERDRWMQNQSSLRALQVRELLDGADVDIDAVTPAIRYPLRRTHLAVVAWRDEDGDELESMERYIDQLAESAGAQQDSLYISVDRLTGWAWIPLGPQAAATAVARMRAFAEERPDAPWIAAGNPLPGVDGFRRSHEQAQEAHAVAIASDSNAQRVTAACDPGLSAAALLSSSLAGRACGSPRYLVRSPHARKTTNDYAKRWEFFCVPAGASRPRPRNCTCIPTPSNIASNAQSSAVADRSPTAGSTSKSRCCSATGMAVPCCTISNQSPRVSMTRCAMSASLVLASCDSRRSISKARTSSTP